MTQTIAHSLGAIIEDVDYNTMLMIICSVIPYRVFLVVFSETHARLISRVSDEKKLLKKKQKNFKQTMAANIVFLILREEDIA